MFDDDADDEDDDDDADDDDLLLPLHRRSVLAMFGLAAALAEFFEQKAVEHQNRVIKEPVPSSNLSLKSKNYPHPGNS